MIQQMEASIITQLQTDLTGVEIGSLTVDPDSYQLLHATGAVLVKYHGAEYVTTGFELGATPADQLDQIPENRALKFEVRLYFRDLQTNYSYLEQVLHSLTGFKPSPAGEMLPVKDAFASELNGISQYFIIFKTNYP